MIECVTDDGYALWELCQGNFALTKHLGAARIAARRQSQNRENAEVALAGLLGSLFCFHDVCGFPSPVQHHWRWGQYLCLICTHKVIGLSTKSSVIR
jgi:hypothetical protein